ncbi:SpoIIAA family protein [Tropicibacter oceani]|uniref:STAS/SEC14 domain-containing protein n=1 Tax=Tropicibacter oceani TaxID=3058420 RepID=A0ABY8QLE0_9RHOB|nr:STAS/SEC14 domain-containing protein [Tropicibacter oceani]WGW05364.1 STAS/SEC14 domain-containing protein [Tropicibacter oceani]
MAFAANTETRTAELTIRGQLTFEDYANIMGPMCDLIDTCGEISVIEVVESFSGFVGEFPEGEDEGVTRMLRRVARVALVSDIGWYCPILSSAAPVGGMKIRSFLLGDLDTARDWVACPKG